MRDFTLGIYNSLILSAKSAGYELMPYLSFMEKGQKGRVWILRHDVDRLPVNSLLTARLEAEAGVKGTYYFRVVRQSFDEEIIQAIAGMGHEIGYHYEDLSLTHGDIDKAYEQFLVNLEKFRKLYPVKTICMHGSPLSRWDNRRLWEQFDYKKSGILAEPYFDTDFSKVFYLTDTSRMWNGTVYSVRDKVNSTFDIKIRSTGDLIGKINAGLLPSQVMMNIHPQRWTDGWGAWTKELVFQNMKNVIKAIVSRF